MQAFLPALRAGRGRILHMGTSVAHRPQEGTLTYGLTKKAFHRLYEQGPDSEGLKIGLIFASKIPLKIA